MKNPYEVVGQKEADLARLRHEIESLQLVASLVSDDETSDELEESAAGNRLGFSRPLPTISPAPYGDPSAPSGIYAAETQPKET